jgi:SAM-dependent methyltransferase
MANWDDGYVTDVPYVVGYHQESTPVWIATAAALLGVAAPDLARPFRYADLGCGNGVTALAIAATMPNAEVWAFDFNPAHVESGRDIARRAGLTNIQFEEASFDELATRPRGALPAFDYIASHGVLSWISLENRGQLFSVIGQCLAPGGIVAISYNVATGWPGIRPVRTLMRLLAETSPERTDLASGGVFDVLDRMKDAGAATFQGDPTLHARLSLYRGHDQRYVAHELLNREWHPLMFPAVESAMAAIKCGYIGGATLQDNHADLTVPAALRELFDQIRDTRLRETFRDIACATSFRRDLYQRGPRRLSSIEQTERVGAIGLVRTPRPASDPIVVRSALGPFTMDRSLCHALFEVIGAGPVTIAQLTQEKALANLPRPALLEAVTLLVGDSYLAPILSEPPGGGAMSASARLNAVHATLFDQGHDRPYLACPVLGGAWNVDPRDILVLDELRNGHAADPASLVDTVVSRVVRSGRQLRQNGEIVTDPAAVREDAAAKVNDMLDHQLPILRRLGVLDAPSAAETEV